jgi:hypothetical protein
MVLSEISYVSGISLLVGYVCIACIQPLTHRFADRYSTYTMETDNCYIESKYSSFKVYGSSILNTK